MSRFFWSGKLTWPMRVLVEANNVLALLTGSFRDYPAMKARVRKGYEGDYTNHVLHYDERGYHLQAKAARYQLEGLQLAGMRVLDVGCGTGALAQVAFEQGARQAVCGDISGYMLHEAKKKQVPEHVSYTFCQLDAEELPFRANAFDAVISGMTFGTLPDQKRAAAEMIRVAKPGGLVCIGAHGPEHYWEAIDASLRCINKRYVLGYRFEWWPRDEAHIRALLEDEPLTGIQTKRIVWQNDFGDGAAAYDFFSAISASWWYAKFPPAERAKDSDKTRRYFARRNIRVITDDIVVAWGYKRTGTT